MRAVAERRPVFAAPAVGLILFASGLIVLMRHPAVGSFLATAPMPFGGLIVLLGGTVCAYLVWSRSRLGAIHLILVGVLFGLTDLADPTFALSGLAGAVAVGWILVFAGVLLLAPKTSRAAISSTSEELPAGPNAWHFAIGYALSALDLLLARSGAIGLKSQLQTGISASGVDSLLVSVAPLFAVLVFLGSVVARRRLPLALGLLLLQSIASSSSGFRGAVLSIGAVAIASLIVALPPSHPWKSKRNLVLLLAGSFAVGVLFFWLGSVVRNQVAAASGLSSSGTQVVTPSEFIPYALHRASLGQTLEVAVSTAGTPPASVAWGEQALALLPRAIFPSKPIVSYGADVAHYYFHEPGNSSSSLTWLGDVWVNGGPPLTVLAAVCVALVLAALESRIARGITALTLPTVVIFASGISSPEGSLPLTMIGLVRAFLVLAVLWTIPLNHRSARVLDPTSSGGVRVVGSPSEPVGAA